MLIPAASSRGSQALKEHFLRLDLVTFSWHILGGLSRKAEVNLDTLFHLENSASTKEFPLIR